MPWPMLHMSLRITKTTSDASTIFRVDGRLVADGVADNEYRPPEEGHEAKDLYRSLIIEDGS